MKDLKTSVSVSWFGVTVAALSLLSAINIGSVSCLIAQTNGGTVIGNRRFSTAMLRRKRNSDHVACYVPSSSSSSLLWLSSSSSSFSLDPIAFLTRNSKKKKKRSRLESAVETAMLLTNQKRQEEWKEDIHKQFPLLPTGVVDACLDNVVTAFADIAPSQLKVAFKPGGLEKIRPDLEETIVTNLKTQSFVQKIPLPEKDKVKLLNYVVNVALDYVFKDVTEMLAPPSDRLQLLEEKRHEITKYMLRRELIWYSIRYHPMRSLLVAAATTHTVYSMYAQLKTTSVATSIVVFLATMKVTTIRLLSPLKNIFLQLSEIVLSFSSMVTKQLISMR